MVFGLGIHTLGFSSWATHAPGWLGLSAVGGVVGEGGAGGARWGTWGRWGQ